MTFIRFVIWFFIPIVYFILEFWKKINFFLYFFMQFLMQMDFFSLFRIPFFVSVISFFFVEKITLSKLSHKLFQKHFISIYNSSNSKKKFQVHFFNNNNNEKNVDSESIWEHPFKDFRCSISPYLYFIWFIHIKYFANSVYHLKYYPLTKGKKS